VTPVAGKIDLDKLVGVARAHGNNLTPGDEGIGVVDRLALRQSWSPRGDASYWIDILWCSKTNLTQVYRSWRFYKKAENKWIEGHCWSGKAASQHSVTKDSFERTVGKMLQKGYLVDERQKTHRSPAHDIDFEGTKIVRAELITEAEDPTPEIYKRGKGTHDWW
jgi:hypothetical protein